MGGLRRRKYLNTLDGKPEQNDGENTERKPVIESQPEKKADKPVEQTPEKSKTEQAPPSKPENTTQETKQAETGNPVENKGQASEKPEKNIASFKRRHLSQPVTQQTTDKPVEQTPSEKVQKTENAANPTELSESPIEKTEQPKHTENVHTEQSLASSEKPAEQKEENNGAGPGTGNSTDTAKGGESSHTEQERHGEASGEKGGDHEHGTGGKEEENNGTGGGHGANDGNHTGAEQAGKEGLSEGAGEEAEDDGEDDDPDEDETEVLQSEHGGDGKKGIAEVVQEHVSPPNDASLPPNDLRNRQDDSHGKSAEKISADGHTQKVVVEPTPARQTDKTLQGNEEYRIRMEEQVKLLLTENDRLAGELITMGGKLGAANSTISGLQDELAEANGKLEKLQEEFAGKLKEQTDATNPKYVYHKELLKVDARSRKACTYKIPFPLWDNIEDTARKQNRPKNDIVFERLATFAPLPPESES